MSSLSIGRVHARTALERVVTIEDVGKAIVRWGLVLVLGWIGAMKFTAYEAMGIQPLVSHSPLLNWMYGLLSVRSFSTMLGFIVVGTAALIALRSVSPKASAVGSVLAIGLVAISLAARAEDLSTATAPLPPGTFTTSVHSDEWKIANALSAGPTTITEHATVVDWPANPKDGMSHGRVLRQGNNGWTCMPDVPGRPQHDPMCVDETMMQWLMATLAGKKPNIDKVGLSYMLMGEARQGQGASPAKDPAQVKEWFYVGPHVMIVLPDTAQDALRGVNQDLSNNLPYVSHLSSSADATPIWVVPVAKGGDRIKEEPLK